MKTRKDIEGQNLRSDYIDRLRMQGSAAFEANISSICEVHKLKQLKLFRFLFVHRARRGLRTVFGGSVIELHSSVKKLPTNAVQ